MKNTKKETTIYDIAQKLNISSATVSRGLQDHPAIKKETRRKFWRQPSNWDTAEILLLVIFADKKPIRLA
jgi:Zn-dependent peptidase ImmA (M78 family)